MRDDRSIIDAEFEVISGPSEPLPLPGRSETYGERQAREWAEMNWLQRIMATALFFAIMLPLGWVIHAAVAQICSALFGWRTH